MAYTPMAERKGQMLVLSVVGLFALTLILSGKQDAGMTGAFFLGIVLCKLFN